MSNLSNGDLDRLIQETLDGDDVAKEMLFDYIQRFVGHMSLRQLGPHSRDPDCIAEVRVRVVLRFLAGDYRRLRAYLQRPERCFTSFLRVVTARVAIDLARSMRRNIAARHENAFRWVKEVELSEPHRARVPNVGSRLLLLDISRYLRTRANPVDVELLQSSVTSTESWDAIASRYDLTPTAARQRVSRLRKSLRDWLERHSH